MSDKKYVKRLIRRYQRMVARRKSDNPKPKRKKKTDAQKQAEFERKSEKRDKMKERRRQLMAAATEKRRQTRLRRKRKNRQMKGKWHYDYVMRTKTPREREREKNGDVKGEYKIMVVRNKKRKLNKGRFLWMSSAYKRYHELIEENKKIVFPVMFRSGKNDTLADVEYEIILVKTIDPTVESNESVFKRDDGTVITTVTDNPSQIILERHPWRVEKDIVVYGYHPVYDKKTCPWLIDNIILKDLSRENTKQIFIWNQYLIIENDFDFDFVQCKNSRESSLLYNTLFDMFSSSKYLFFTGVLNPNLCDKWREKLKEKTGWSDIKISRDENI